MVRALEMMANHKSQQKAEIWNSHLTGTASKFRRGSFLLPHWNRNLSCLQWLRRHRQIHWRRDGIIVGPFH